MKSNKNNSPAISRRHFGTGMITAGAAGLLLPGLAGFPAAAAPMQGGRLRLAVAEGNTGDTIDPARTNTGTKAILGFQFRNALLEIDPSGSLIGELAEGWENSADVKTWTFSLRKGVTFHSGKSLTAADVIESLNHHRGEDSKSGGKGLLSSVQDLSAPDDGTVVFKLSEGNLDFPYYLAEFFFTICPALPGGGIDWESGDGTGPYVLESFEPGVSALTTRNPNYWKAGRGHFDAIETSFVTDSTARFNGLRTGAFDIMMDPDPKTAGLIDDSPGFRVLNIIGSRHNVMPMLTDVAPFDNNDVRMALKYAIDREQLSDLVYGGRAAVGNDQPIGSTYRFHATADELPQRAYDPDKAKFHLEKAGMPDITIPLSVADTGFKGSVDAAVLFKESAARAGITINVTREPNDGYWSNVWLNKPFCASHWGGAATEDLMFSQAYESGTAWNETRFSNGRFDELLKMARTELDEGKRRDMYVEAQQIVSNEGGSLIPLFTGFAHAVSDKVATDETISGQGLFDGFRGTERWWFNNA